VSDVEQKAKKRAALGWFIRLAGSAVALGVTLWILPREAIFMAFAKVDWAVWFAILIVYMACHAVAALKWRLLASDNGDITMLRALRAHAGGLAANMFLPGTAGGDVVRAAIAMKGARSKTHVAVGSFADRIIDTLALLFIAAVGAGLSAVGSASISVLGQVSVFVIGAVAAMVALVYGLRFAPMLPFAGLRRKLVEVAVEFARRPMRLAVCFALSVAIQAAFVALAIVFADAVGAKAPAAAWYFASPLAKLISVVPVSLAGLGVREAALAALLSPFGASAALVVAASLLWQSVLFAGGGISALVLFFGPRDERAAANGFEAANKEPA